MNLDWTKWRALLGGLEVARVPLPGRAESQLYVA